MPSGLGIVASAVWTPLDLAPALWLDAADPATITASGGAVSQWADKSGHGHHVAQTVAASQPATGVATWNGRNVVTFAGDYLSDAGGADWTFMHDGTVWTALLAVKAGVSADPNAVYGFFGTNAGTSANTGGLIAFDDRASLGRNNGLNAYVTRGAGGSIVVSVTNNNTLTANAAHVVRTVLDPGNATAADRYAAWVDGVGPVKGNTNTDPPTGADPTFPLDIGAVGNGVVPLTGQIAEIIIVPRALTATETTTAENYLSDKWGI